MNSLQLSQLVCTRISHDIIGNIGAVSNALELFEEGDTDFFEDIRNVLSVSSRVLSSRTKFFRLAFGLDNAAVSDKKIVFDAINNYLASLGNGQNPERFMAENIQSEQNRQVMLTAMMFADVMPKGGEIKACFYDNKLWIAAHADAYSRDRLEAFEKILGGSEEYNTNAQYAHIIMLKEILGDEYKAVLAEASGPALVISKK